MTTPVIISLTTTMARREHIRPTLDSLFHQTVKADEVRLYQSWLPDGKDATSSDGYAPTRVVTADKGPVTKISAVCDEAVPADAIVVTVDDDQVYAPTWLETLLAAGQQYPEEALGWNGWNAADFIRYGVRLRRPGRGEFLWAKPGETCDVLEGFSGPLYRKAWFDEAVLSPPDLYRWVDDVWISSYLHHRGIGRRVIAPRMCFDLPLGMKGGIHHRKDFKALNARAAVAGFRAQPARAAAPPRATPVYRGSSDILLSICIPSMHSRLPSLTRVLEQLRAQPRSHEVEILVATDAGNDVLGNKRNRLVAMAKGRYIVHVDDDDMVAPDYIPKVLSAIEAYPGVDIIVLHGRRTGGGAAVEFDFDIAGPEVETRDGVVWRSAGHWCPLRADLAKRVPFPLASFGEDTAWVHQISPLLKTSSRAGGAKDILYSYQWKPDKPVPAAPAGPPHAGIFTPQYAQSSGPGSTLEASRPWREWLSAFCQAERITSVVDLACGDGVVMSGVDLHGASYLGIDVIAERIAKNGQLYPDKLYLCADLQHYEIAPADLIICKDCLQHWNNAEVGAFLAKLDAARGRYRYALLVNDRYGPTINTDTPTGQWRALDLTAAPFYMGAVVFRWEMARGPHTDYKDVVLVRGTADAPA